MRVQRRCDGERGAASRRTSEHALHCTDEHAQVGRPREAVWRSTRYILRTACSGFAPATPILHLTVGTRVVAASPAVPSTLPTLALAVHLSRPTRVPGCSCAQRARLSTPLGNGNGGVTEKDQKRGGYHSACCSFCLPLDVALGVETGRCSAGNPFERESPTVRRLELPPHGSGYLAASLNHKATTRLMMILLLPRSISTPHFEWGKKTIIIQLVVALWLGL